MSQPDFATAPRARRLPAWDGVLLAVAALALAVSAGQAWRGRAEAAEAVERLGAVRQDVEQKSARLRALTPASAPAAALRPAPSRILAAIAKVLPGDARLERLTIDYTHGVALELQVVARDAAAWDRLLARMERSTDFGEVEPGAEAREAEVRSVVRARWAGGAP